MQDAKLQAFRDTLPADEAAELDRLLQVEWPDGLAETLIGRIAAISTLCPTHLRVVTKLIDKGWRATAGVYRLKDKYLSDILNEAIADSIKLRRIERLTAQTRHGIETAIGVSPRLAEVE